MASYSLIHRTTLFKVPDMENQKTLIKAYGIMLKDAVKDGKPYIQHASVERTVDDQRAKGYTVLANHRFASMEDVEYYDKECPAHAALRKLAAGLGIPEPPVVVHVKTEHQLIGV